MENSISIIRLPVTEWQKYKQLRLDAVLDSPEAFCDTFREESARPDHEWQARLRSAQKPGGNLLLFAQKNNNVVGMAGALVSTNDKMKHIATIVSVYVTKQERGKGIAKQLLDALLDELQKNPAIIKVQLSVDIQAQEAIRVYESLGFSKKCIHKKELYVDGKYVDQYHIEKYIQQV